MALKRDGTGTLESEGSLLEILEMSGEKHSLEGLKYLDDRPLRESMDLLDKWLREITRWFDSLPKLIDTIKKELGLDKIHKKITETLEGQEVLLQNEIAAALMHLDFLDDLERRKQLRDQLVKNVIEIERSRLKIYEQLEHSEPQLSSFLSTQKPVRLLEKAKIIAEEGVDE